MKTYKIIVLLFTVSFLNIRCQNKTKTDNIIESEITEIENGIFPIVQIKGDEVKYSLTEQMSKYSIQGISIAVIENGIVRWSKGYGKSNKKDSVNTETIFQAGSISKPLAALLTLKLIDENLLDLDTDVNTYLKSWKLDENQYTKKEKVTIRKILSHTAGITVSGFSGYNSNENVPSLNQILSGEAKSSKIEIDTIPGSLWRYSGGGYTILQKIIEDVTKKSFEENMRQKIFEPLNMSRSNFYPLTKEIKTNMSSGYDKENMIADGWLNYYQPAAAGLWSTSSDIAKFCIAIQNSISGKSNAIISSQLAKEMLTAGMNNWGLGVEVVKNDSTTIFKHGGNTKGYTASFRAVINKGSGIVIMTNSDMEEQLINDITRTVSVNYNWGMSSPKVVSSIALPKNKLKKYVGDYKYSEEIPGRDEYVINFNIENDKLVFATDNGNLDLIYQGEDKFVMHKNGREIVFETTNNIVTSMIMDGLFKFIKKEEEYLIENTNEKKV